MSPGPPPSRIDAGAALGVGGLDEAARAGSLLEGWQCHPHGLSRFELYEDDGSSNAYRRGQYPLTALECAAGPGAVTGRIAEAGSDRSVVPAGRRFLLELRMDLPQIVTAAGYGELRRLAGAPEGRAGWWRDARGFTGVRLPDSLRLPVTVTLRT